MKYASFCWHTENMYFSALNYHHKGADKTWYFIPESGKELFDNYVEKKGFNKSIINKIVLQVDPLELINNKVIYYTLLVRFLFIDVFKSRNALLLLFLRCIIVVSHMDLISLKPSIFVYHRIYTILTL